MSGGGGAEAACDAGHQWIVLYIFSGTWKNMHRMLLRLLPLLALLCFMVSCSPYKKEIREIDAAYRAGTMPQAIWSMKRYVLLRKDAERTERINAALISAANSLNATTQQLNAQNQANMHQMWQQQNAMMQEGWDRQHQRWDEIQQTNFRLMNPKQSAWNAVVPETVKVHGNSYSDTLTGYTAKGDRVVVKPTGSFGKLSGTVGGENVSFHKTHKMGETQYYEADP